MTGPRCIVCNKPIPKRTTTLYFYKAHASRPDGTVVQDSAFSKNLYLAHRPQTKAEAQRFTNETVVSISRHGGEIISAGVWDGTSYQDEFFHSLGCAAQQGRASAQAGHRWTWNR